MRVLGITGSIATGKSVVMAMLAERGAPTLSADALAHDLTAPGTDLTRAVLAAFPACADKANSLALDRRALAEIVFADAAARRRLEAILHPPIIAALAAQAQAWRALTEPRAGALEIPLLFEAGLEGEGLVDVMVVVGCSPAAQAARLRARGMDVAEAARRIAAQWPLAEKAARADVVINTDGTLDDTRQQVDALWQQLS